MRVRPLACSYWLVAGLWSLACGSTTEGTPNGSGSGGHESVEVVPYRHHFTYDILPASDSGTYFAAGMRIGSTLVTATPPARPLRPAR
jgi:hypothetical protein